MSVLVLRRTLFPSVTFQQSIPTNLGHIRHIHPTILALKKKKTSPRESDYDFSFEPLSENDELFGLSSHQQRASTGVPTRPSPDGVKTSELLRIRTELFEEQWTSVLDILGRPGMMRQPPRKSTVARLTGLAERKEDLEKVVDVIAAWRSAALSHDLKTSNDFIGRCIRLKCPELALKVLQDRPKYGMDVPSLTSARRLLHALAQPRTKEDDSTRPLVECLAFAEVYPLYDLPQASTDVVSCAILAGVIARRAKKDERNVDQQEGAEVTVASDPWREILAEFETTTKGWQDIVGTTSPNVLRWLRGGVDDVRLTMRRKEGKIEDWLRRFQKKIRSLTAERRSLAANA